MTKDNKFDKVFKSIIWVIIIGLFEYFGSPLNAFKMFAVIFVFNLIKYLIQLKMNILFYLMNI